MPLHSVYYFEMSAPTFAEVPLSDEWKQLFKASGFDYNKCKYNTSCDCEDCLENYDCDCDDEEGVEICARCKAVETKKTENAKKAKKASKPSSTIAK